MIEPIVSEAWLQQNETQIIICDVRTYMDGRIGKDAYEEGHIPGAIFVDLETVLSSDPGPVVGRHPLSSPDEFATGLGHLGIGNDAVVVAYDDMGGAFAGRLIWMLRILGQPAALLDGGISSWSGALEAGTVSSTPTTREPLPWPPLATVDSDEVAGHISKGGVVIDSRALPRYLGEIEPIDARAGHVPGAINLPFTENLDVDGVFVDRHSLRARFEQVGASSDTVVYCGSGVTACHNALAMEAAGLGRPRVYVGSWSGWSSEPGREVATGIEG